MSIYSERNLRSTLLAAFFVFYSIPSVAGIVINGTRIIYPQKEKIVTVQLTNEGEQPVLAQSWIDNGDISADPRTIKVPFILTPPVNRIEPKRAQTLRISYTGQPLPQDKESVFYLNVLEIPSMPKNAESSNVLQMAFRTRIKLFFRPDNLRGKPADAARQLRWRAENNKLSVTNPAAYNVSIVSVSLKKNTNNPVEGKMVTPGGKEYFSLPGASTGTKITFQWINDYGAIITEDGVIQ